MDFKSFCYDHFGFIGDRIASAFPWLDKWIEVSVFKLHPSVYGSIIFFASILSLSASIPFILLIFVAVSGIDLPQYIMHLLYPLSFLPIPLIISFTLLPLIVFIFGLILPIITSKNRVYDFELELPYVSAYLTVIVSSGLPLYNGLKRLIGSKLFHRTSMYVNRIEVSSMVGSDTPIFIVEDFAGKLNVKGFKELISGYVSTLRSGGDVANYVYRRTEMLFQEMLSRVKSVAERLGILMEALITVVCLGGIGLYLFFIASVSMSDVMGMPAISGETFFLFSFILLPLINVIFIYLADSSQISYPEKVLKRYIPFIASLPILLLSLSLIILPYVFNMSIIEPLIPIVKFVEWFAEYRAGNIGFTPAIMLCLSLIVVSIPGAIYDLYLSRVETSYESGLASFLRDLVETRKSGLPPEKCLVMLSYRRYGRLNRILDRVRRGIVWGLPLRKVFDEICASLDDWLVSVNLFLLVDTIEIGGGSVETLESMARFSETSLLIESEKRSLLKPLMLVPYFGAILLILVGLTFLSFMNGMMAVAGTSLPMVSMIKILMTPIPLQTYTLGLAAGKIGGGRVSGGFIHAILLTLVDLLAILFSSSINLSSILMGG